MKTLLTLIFCVAIALPAIAGPKGRTIVIRDGKVIEAPEIMELPLTMFAGRTLLGVVLVDASAELREHLGGSKNAGVLVSEVGAGSPAEKAGIRVGDLILSVDGQEVASSGALRRAMKDKDPGDTARIEALRGRTRQTFVATLAEREGPRILETREWGELGDRLGTAFSGPEWRARIATLGDCGDLQTRIKDLESRLKDLEKKLPK